MKYFNFNYFLVFCCTILAVASGLEQLPNFLQVCSRSDPNINQCILNSVESLRPYFIDGIPELYMPSLNPLIIPEIKIDQSTGPIFINSKYENIMIYGLSEFIIHNIETNIVKDEFMLKLQFPNLNLSAIYKIDGKLMMMPIKGQGNLNGNFTNLIVTAFLKGDRYMKTNEINELIEHIRIKDTIIKYTIGDSSINLDNLFNGEPTLGATMNTFLNDNWKAFASEVKPVMQDTIAEMLKSATDKFFDMFSFEQLFPV